MELRLQRLGTRAFAMIGEDGNTNFGIVRGDDGAALLIDADIRRMEGIEEALRRADCGASSTCSLPTRISITVRPTTFTSEREPS